MDKIKVGIIVGSARKESLNLKLAKAFEKIGHPQLVFNRLRIDDLPLFNQDHEKSPPDAVKRFKSEVKAADAILFVTPEHNRSLPALLKNAIDWANRPYGENAWNNKVAALSGTSPGALGTAAAQFHLRQILSSIGVRVMPLPEMFIKFEEGLIKDDGEVTNPKTQDFFGKFLASFADFVNA